MRLAVAVLALAAASAHADDARWYLQVDNDVLAGTDRWYTSGVRIARVWAGEETRTEWGLLHEVFTPEAKRWQPGVDDRAPAARLLAYGARHFNRPEAFDTVEIALGVRGPSALGEEATRAVHRLVPAPAVDWSREEPDRFDAQLAAVRSLRVSDGLLDFGAVLGTQQVFAHAGFEWHFGAPALRLASSSALRFAATPPPASADPGWGAFLGANVRGVARNAMIRRNYDPFGPELEPKHAVGRAAAGVAWADRWGSIAFVIVQESKEFDAQRQAQAFGSLVVHVAF